jgi:hypothetical protein
MSTDSAKLYARAVQGKGELSGKIDSLAKAIIALADAIDGVEQRLKRLR